jgi:transposase
MKTNDCFVRNDCGSAHQFSWIDQRLVRDGHISRCGGAQALAFYRLLDVLSGCKEPVCWGLCAPKPRTARRGRRSGELIEGCRADSASWQDRSSMDANILFGQALGLGSGWKVVKSEMNVAGRELKIWLDFESGSQFACPRCGAFCPIHDTVEKKWRHLDFWQHRTELIARVPRTHCEEHGILQAAVPWARPGSGFTLMMEAMILLLGQQMSVSAAARHLGESDKRLWRVLEHYVMEAHAAKDWSAVRRLMIDETSARKGQRYVTVVLDAES